MFKNVKKFTLVFLSVILIQTSLTQVVFANEGYEEEDNHVALQNQLENEKLVTIDIINNLEYLNSNEKKEFILDVKNATHVTTVVTIKNHALTKNHKVMMRFLFEQEVVVLKELIKNGPLHEEDRFKLISRIDTISLAFTYEINDVYIYDEAIFQSIFNYHKFELSKVKESHTLLSENYNALMTSEELYIYYKSKLNELVQLTQASKFEYEEKFKALYLKTQSKLLNLKEQIYENTLSLSEYFDKQNTVLSTHEFNLERLYQEVIYDYNSKLEQSKFDVKVQVDHRTNELMEYVDKHVIP